MLTTFNFGKYRGIIASIALFILLDASVLLMNFYISFEIADDAVGVNIAGRQRMLSQRMMKSLLDAEIQEPGGQARNQVLEELSQTTRLFNTTLSSFDRGGATQGAGSESVFINRVVSPESIKAIAEAKIIWQPFYGLLQLLLSPETQAEPERFEHLLDEAIAYGRQHNIALLGLMNDLTVDLENVASSKAERLRWIQTVGITLAIFNFFIIMFHFLRQLSDSDRKIEMARRETQEILETVNEGLFLLDKDLRIGKQCSGEMVRLFGRREAAGLTLSEYLSGIISEKDLTITKNFIDLLFDPYKKQKLLGDLNPLREVTAHIPNEDGSFISKHLSFSFSRVMEKQEIVHVLVTVLDISRQVQLAKELDLARLQGQEQLHMLSAIMACNGDMLKMFLDNSHETFNKINELLKSQVKSADQYRDKANSILRLIHNYKGEASALDLASFVDIAHQFEDQLADIKGRSNISGNDFLGLVVQLEKLIQQTEYTYSLVNKVAAMNAAVSPASDHPSISLTHVTELAQKIAERQFKDVEVICSGFNDYRLKPEAFSKLNTMIIQLVRNAVSHGIESKYDRMAAQKVEIGNIRVSFVRRRSGEFCLSVADDGAGVNIKRIREVAIARGVIAPAEADVMDSKQVVSLIFHPDLSTRDEVDEDSGRGVGLSALREMVKDLGGKITINSRQGQGCEFMIALPASIQQVSSAAEEAVC